MIPSSRWARWRPRPNGSTSVCSWPTSTTVIRCSWRVRSTRCSRWRPVVSDSAWVPGRRPVLDSPSSTTRSAPSRWPPNCAASTCATRYVRSGRSGGATPVQQPDAAFAGLTAIVDGHPAPRIVVGASAWATIEVAVEEADGVNIRLGPSVPDYVRRVRELAPSTFEVSVLTQQSTLEHERIAELAAAGVDRVIFVSPPSFDATPFTSR